ncbi:hypothetical protein [Marivirga sp.]|uniref:hypothetical protein n=1 Tax=Marivirga sp. TaxID=2018662 RepID=UPI0025EB5288|nr:hypothetical protein [Marivirga sp.]
MAKEIDYSKIDIREIDIDKISPTGFVTRHKLDFALNKLKEIKTIIDELLDLRDQNDNIPSMLKSKISGFEQNMRSFIQNIVKEESGSADQIARQKVGYLSNIDKYYNNTFNIDQNNSNKLLEVYTIVKSLNHQSSNNLFDEKLKSFREEFEHLTKEITNEKESIIKNSAESETILNELKKKTSEETVSDYALVFKNEATKASKLANKWLIAGIILSTIFIIGFILLNASPYLNTEVLDDQGNLIRYSISNLVAKIFLISIFVFLISFSFKQYSVNKHQETLSKHRQNALNSYKLFTQSIVGEDENSRNALMVQVAKAIYEQTQSTGFISDRNQSNSPGIVELTKIVGSSTKTSQ